MRRQWSTVAQGRVLHLDYESERRTGCGGSGATAPPDGPRAPGRRNGEQDAEAVEHAGPGGHLVRRQVGTEKRRRGQWGGVDDRGQEDPAGCRNGEQDAEAVERHLLWTLPPSRRGRNGEQDAEAVERVLARRIRVAPASRNGEQDAEAVEPEGVAVPIERDHAGRNGEQDAEAVELVEVGQRI